jgi:eukaryotic-like serine/threonine-protein kinase
MLRPGTHLGPFEITGPLGAGGMGEVYRARDTRLCRDVAIKVLPAEFASDPDRLRRFEQEARAVAALNHPNILAIHDVGTHDAIPYLVTELLEGESLRDRLRAGGVTVRKAVETAVQIAQGLAAAHEKGIVHRDLKPGNVFVTTNGQVKILDFGLAKLTHPETPSDPYARTVSGEPSTESGAVLGTMGYTSPEQLRGERADARSDIFSFGCVLYEMLAGKSPFLKATGAETVTAIMSEDPAPLSGTGRAVAPALQEIVSRCLEKRPEDRFSSAHDLALALRAYSGGSETPATAKVPARGLRLPRRWLWTGMAALGVVAVAAVALYVLTVRGHTGTPTAAGLIRSIAVLPLTNLSGDPGQEYFSDGMTEELITTLSKISALKVISRTSVMQFKGTKKSLREIAAALGVEGVIEGSVLRVGERVRITAQLINAATDTHLWAESYDRDLKDVLALQSDVARAVAGEVRAKLTPQEQTRLASSRPVNPEAHDAYLKGSYHWKKLTRAEIDTAERYFDLALAKDPSYAPAHQGLAWVWAARQQMGLVPAREAGPKAKAAALEAIRLDESSAEAHEALALVRSWTDWDWTGAAPEWKRTLELNPNGANAHAYYSHFLANVGRPDEALTHIGRALELDPFNALFHAMRAVVLSYHGRSDEVIAEARTALAMQPDLPPALSALRRAWFAAGMRDELLADLRQQVARDPEYAAAFERGLAEGGFDGALRRLVDVMVARYQVSGPRPGLHAMGIAIRCIYTRDYGRAMDWLEKAYEEHEPNLPYLGEHFYDPLRSNPRFQALFRRMNLPMSAPDDNRQPTGGAS